MMHRELELLIKLNDLELLIKETEGADAQAVEKGLGFKVQTHEGLLALRTRLREAVRAESLARFDRAWKRYGRAMAPVSDGVCCGCFARLPTSLSPSTDPGSMVPTCPYCARLLYWPLT